MIRTSRSRPPRILRTSCVLALSSLLVATTAVSASAAPSAPGNLQATANDGSVALQWEPADPDLLDVTSYTVHRDGAVLASVDGATHAYVDATVTNGQCYAYTVTASDALGEGPPSNEVQACPLALPPAPTGLTAEAGDERVTLTWDPIEEPHIIEYHIERDGAFRAQVSGGGTTNVDGLVENRVCYRYVVIARSHGGWGPPSDEVEACPTTPLPSEPTNVQDTSTTGSNVRHLTITWDPPADLGEPGSPVVNYHVYNRFGDLVATVRPDKRVFRANYRASEGGHWFIAAENASGEGDAASVFIPPDGCTFC